MKSDNIRKMASRLDFSKLSSDILLKVQMMMSQCLIIFMKNW